MHEMTVLPTCENAVKSIAIFIGTGACNARCSHCAGLPHRKNAPREDRLPDEALVRRTLAASHARGARALSISSSGEPTLSPRSVTRLFEIVDEIRSEGITFASIHLYSNGIRIGQEQEFCERYLPLWRGHGLDTIYLTIHALDERENARTYGVASYPPLPLVFARIQDADLRVRANMMLSTCTVHTLESFISSVESLCRLGADRIAAWPIRGQDDRPDLALAPSPEEIARIREWVREHGVAYKTTLLGEETCIQYHSGQKLTLFPDGTLSSTWCNH